MSWYSFRPYVSVGQRRLQAKAAAKKLAGKGRVLAPVQIEGRKIASTYWGKAWCDNLESYSDYEYRLPRGRSYVRNGSVIDLQIARGKIEALVQGSDLYKISVTIRPLEAKRWQEFKTRCAGRITNLLDLLQGRLSSEILTDIATQGTGLFPSPTEITLQCSCPDWADMCKHVAAALYGIGARLDAKPELFFTLRAVEMQDLITTAGAEAAAAPAAESALDSASLSEIFGVEIETAPAAPTAPRPKATVGGVKKRRKPKPSSASGKTVRKPKSARKKALGKKPASHRGVNEAKRKVVGKSRPASGGGRKVAKPAG
jgi:uncharacterized Zn finger protein